MLFVKKHAYITFNLKDFSPSKAILWDIVKVGMPASLSMVIMAMGQGVFNKILINYSSETVAAYQVAGRIDMLIFLPIFAIAGAMTTLVGMFYGAKELSALNQVIHYGIKSAFLITLIASTFCLFFCGKFFIFVHKRSRNNQCFSRFFEIALSSISTCCYSYNFRKSNARLR